MTTLIYGDEYCIGLIQAALGKSNKNGDIEKSKIKRLTIERVDRLKEVYGLEHSEIFSDISFHFLSKSKIMDIDDDKGSPTTFILQYVFNQLRNMERKCQRGTYYGKETDAMSEIDPTVFDLFENESVIDKKVNGVDNDDPESLLIRDEMAKDLQKRFTEAELNKIMSGNTSQDLRDKINIFRAEWC